MIINLKLYLTLSGSGAHAVLVKLWTQSSSYQASVPLPARADVKGVRSSFSSIRSNFVGLNEDDWQSFDSMLQQMGSGKNEAHPALKLAMSLACARAATDGQLWRIRGEQRRFPYIAGIAARGRVWKEFLLIPHREREITEAFRMLLEAWKVVGEEMKGHGVLRGRTSTGAWISDLSDTETLYLLDQVAKDWGMGLGVNVGAGSFWNGTEYDYGAEAGGSMKKILTPQEQMSLLSAVIEHYNIGYVEDPFHGSDFTSHAQLSHKFEDIVVAGASIYGGDPSRMKRAYRYRPTDAVAIRPRDLRTVSQLSEISEFVRGKGLKLCLSVFDDETGDDWISDLSVAFGASMLKLGVTGAANTEKYSRLLEMWDESREPSLGKMMNY